MQKEEEQIGWFLPIFLDLPAVLLMTTRDCIWGTQAHPPHSWQNAQSIQLSMLSSWQEQLLQMRNHGLAHTGEGERPLGHGSSCSSFHLPGFWKAGRSLPQASPNSSTFPTVVSTPVTQSIMCSFPPSPVPRQGDVPALAAGCRQEQHPWWAGAPGTCWSTLSSWDWQSPSLPATKCKFSDSDWKKQLWISAGPIFLSKDSDI